MAARGAAQPRAAGGALSRTFLWAYHRSISHAFARSILEIPSARVLHEVYLAAVVFGPDRDESVYSSFGPVRECSSFAAIRDRLARWDGERGVSSDQQHDITRHVAALIDRWSLTSRKCCSDPSHQQPRNPTEVGTDRHHLFVKCSPLYQMGQDLHSSLPPLGEVYSDAEPVVQLPSFRHTFLIRRPDKVALSLQRLENGNDSSNTQAVLEGDLVETHRLYRFVDDKCGSNSLTACTNPLIIDADDLLCSPSTIMSGYCRAVGLPYDTSILQWNPGPVLEWLPDGATDWEAGPFANVFRCNGFVSPSHHEGSEATIEQNMDKLSKGTRAVLEQRWDLYDQMYTARFKPPVGSK